MSRSVGETEGLPTHREGLQAFTHGHVLGIGQQVLTKLEAEYDNKLRQAVEECKKEADKKAAERQEAALTRARQDADDEIRSLRAQFEAERKKAVKEERRQTTEEMEERAARLLSEERQSAAEHLQQTLADAAREAKRRERLAVEKGRAEEFGLAQERAKVAGLEAEKRLEYMKMKKDEERKEALKDLAKLKDEEKRQAVEEACRALADQQARDLSVIRSDHERQLNDLRKALNAEKKLRDAAEEALSITREERRKLDEELQDWKKEIAKFIDNIPGLCSDFLMK